MKFRYKQELVLQLPANSVKDYDTFIELENNIAAGLKNLGEVDGHDFGVGEMNIFVRTDCPKLAFEKIKSLIERKILCLISKPLSETSAKMISRFFFRMTSVTSQLRNAFLPVNLQIDRFPSHC